MNTGALIGLDLGTSGVRALAVDTAGRVLASATRSYPLSTPRPGWTEQDPERWWRATIEVIGRVAAESGAEVLGIGLSGQMHGAVFLDGAGRVIRPAPLWNDQRTVEQCGEIERRIGRDRLLEIAGNPALTGFQAPKVLWLREHEPEHYQRLAAILLPKDFIRFRLSGVHATDASDAAGTLFLDVGARRWSEEICHALEVPTGWLPEVFEGPEVAGRLSSEAAALTGLRPGLPIAAGGGDNAAAAVGVGVLAPGTASVSIGTSGVVFAPSERFTPDPSGRVHAFCHAVPGAYHLMGVMLSAGGALQWWRQVMAADSYAALDAAAAAVPSGAEGLVFLPFLSGERTPWLDPRASGAFFGLTLRHRPGHLTRAVMEGVAFGLRDCLDVIAERGVAVAELRAVGGGARSQLWLGILADVLDRPIRRCEIDEGPAYGAALLAGAAAGIFADIAEAASLVRVRPEVVEPDAGRTRLYAGLHQIYQDLYRVGAESMHRLFELTSPERALDA